jgi:uncharacterized protein YcbX
MTIRIEQIYRYPVKGMRAEQLQTGTLEAGGGLALDRAFAFTSGNLPPPAGAQGWSPSRTFLQMTVYPRLAGFAARVDGDSLRVTAPDGQTASAALEASDDSALNGLMNQHFKAGPEGGIRLHRIQQPPATGTMTTPRCRSSTRPR